MAISKQCFRGRINELPDLRPRFRFRPDSNGNTPVDFREDVDGLDFYL
jgi:hypothetical protein